MRVIEVVIDVGLLIYECKTNARLLTAFIGLQIVRRTYGHLRMVCYPSCAKVRSDNLLTEL